VGELTNQVAVMHDLLKEIHRLPNLVYILKADKHQGKTSRIKNQCYSGIDGILWICILNGRKPE
jgi:hypothetical protein